MKPIVQGGEAPTTAAARKPRARGRITPPCNLPGSSEPPGCDPCRRRRHVGLPWPLLLRRDTSAGWCDGVSGTLRRLPSRGGSGRGARGAESRDFAGFSPDAILNSPLNGRMRIQGNTARRSRAKNRRGVPRRAPASAALSRRVGRALHCERGSSALYELDRLRRYNLDHVHASASMIEAMRLATPARFERATPQIRNLVLYPAELRGPADRRSITRAAPWHNVLADLKSSKSKMARPRGQVLPSQVERFSKVIRAKLADRSSGFAKDDLRAVVDEIVVRDRMATISASHLRLMAAMAPKKRSTDQAPSFIQGWRAREDKLRTLCSIRWLNGISIFHKERAALSTINTMNARVYSIVKHVDDMDQSQMSCQPERRQICRHRHTLSG